MFQANSQITLAYTCQFWLLLGKRAYESGIAEKQREINGSIKNKYIEL